MKYFNHSILLLVILFLLSCLLSCSGDDRDPVTFTVIGDVPYSSAQIEALPGKIEGHNNAAASTFVVHVGDIKRGTEPCDEEVYVSVSTMLRAFSVPTFMLLGDNEFNDCIDPAQARSFWDTYFLNFHEEWTFGQNVKKQDIREENWAWEQDGVLFVGVNVVGSIRHDQAEWEQRLTDDGAWLEEQFLAHGEDAYAAVVFGHANMVDFGSGKFQVFIDALVSEANTFGKPTVYIQGDGHKWIDDIPWEAPNLRRIQIDGGTQFVEVVIDENAVETIRFDPDAF